MAYLPMKYVLQLLSLAFCNASYKDYRNDHRLQDPAEPMGYQQTTVDRSQTLYASHDRLAGDSSALVPPLLEPVHVVKAWLLSPEVISD